MDNALDLLEKFLSHPILWGVLALVAFSVALTGRLSISAAVWVVWAAWALAVFGIYRTIITFRLDLPLSFLVLGALGCSLAIGALLTSRWYSEKESHNQSVPTAVHNAPESAQTPANQLTLHYLYEHDFDDMLRLKHPFSLTDAASGKVVSLEAQLYQDFPARSEFLGVYLPHTSPAETYKDAVLFAEFYQDFLKSGPESSSAFLGEEMMSSKDLKFSGRVFIYHEDLLPLEQRASLETIYKNKGLAVQFRGLSYLAGKILSQRVSQPASAMQP